MPSPAVRCRPRPTRPAGGVGLAWPATSGGAMHRLLGAVDWEREEEAAVELLRALIRFATPTPPGTEAECLAFLADHLRQGGLEPELVEPAPRRANLVVRLPAVGDGDLPPLLLNGHGAGVAAG